MRCLWLPLLLLLSTPLAAEWHSEQQSVMGTRVELTFWHPDPEVARQAVAAVMAEMHRIDQLYSPYKDASELSRLNRLAPTASAESPVSVSAELVLLLDRSLHYGQLTGGAFDITFGSLGRHYDFREGRQPSAEQRAELLPALDYRLVHLDAAARQVYFGHPMVYVDLGGIAKGYAVDRAIAILQTLGVEHASVSAGGDSRVLGDRRGRPWLVGIKNPRAPESVAITLPLDNVAISTSGDYERYFVDRDGRRVHHILNPRTGESAGGLVSVTVLGPTGFDTDPLSTAVFVLGVERGLALLDQMPAFDAILIDAAGRVHYTQGLAPPGD